MKIKKVGVERIDVETDPSDCLFEITVEYEDGSVWQEIVHYEHEIRIFRQGLCAGYGPMVPLIEIPRRAVRRLVPS
jgi:hypothetical protein